VDSRTWQEAITDSFKCLLGIDKLTKAALLLDPYRIDQSLWPKNPATNEALIHFHWHKSATNPHNKAALVKILKDVKVKGPHLSLTAAICFADITDEALMEQIETKYEYTCKMMKKVKNLENLRGDIDEAMENGDEERLQEYMSLYLKKSTDRAALNSRATRVSDISNCDSYSGTHHVPADGAANLEEGTS
jgi:hypothetical protein